jgi:hypothetical protein
MGGIAFAAVRPALGQPVIWRTFKAGALAGATRGRIRGCSAVIATETNISTEGNQHEYPKSIKPR